MSKRSMGRSAFQRRAGRSSRPLKSAIVISSILATTFAVGISAGQAQGLDAPILVDSTVDEIETNGRCSLREAIAAANHRSSPAFTAGDCPAGDVIHLGPGSFGLTRRNVFQGVEEDLNSTGDFDITTDVTIKNGAPNPANRPTIDGSGIDRVFDIHGGATVRLEGLDVTGGRGGTVLPTSEGADGGGIRNVGTLTLVGVSIRNTRAGNAGVAATLLTTAGAGGDGGGVFNSGSFILMNSTIAGATAGNGTPLSGDGGSGGGIFNTGQLTMIDSAVLNTRAGDAYPPRENGVPGNGGGVYNTGNFLAANGTIANNSPGKGPALRVSSQDPTGKSLSGLGGGVYNNGVLNLTNVTVAGNTVNSRSADIAGSGIFSNSIGTLRNTIVAGIGVKCSGAPLADGGANLSFSSDRAADNSCPGTNGDPKLGPLQHNGGFTPTMTLSSGSAALEAGKDEICIAKEGPPDFGSGSKDQRGIARPQGQHCDIGAVENTTVPRPGAKAASVTLKLEPTKLPADGDSTTRAAVTLKDADGYAVSDEELRFEASDAEIAIGPVTNWNDGTYTAAVTASRFPGDHQITARVLGAGISGTADLTLLPNPWAKRRLTDMPTGSYQASIAYDPETRQTVHFGGFNHALNRATDETWIWDGDSWQKAEPSLNRPSPRFGAAIAWDTARGMAVLYGGCCDASNNRLRDTWAWDGANWQKVDDLGPPPREGWAMVYDEARKLVVLVGPSSDPNGPAEMWAWHGKWELRKSILGPTSREFPELVYDQARQEIVLFGGLKPRVKPTEAGFYYNDTWVWDGTTWREKASRLSPGRRNRSGFVYDSSRHVSILFGGYPERNGHLGSSDTWTWDGERWAEVTPIPPATSPAKRFGHSMIYDQSRGIALLFGGISWSVNYTDTWVLDPSRLPPANTPDFVRPCPESGYPAQEGQGWSTLDPSFGCNGRTVSDLGRIMDMALTPKGTVVAAGHNLAQYNPDGSLDGSFAEDGWAAIPRPEAGLLVGVAIDRDQKVVAVGQYLERSGPPWVNYIARYTPTGSLDSSFGDGGRTIDKTKSFYGRPAIQERGILVLGNNSGGGPNLNDPVPEDPAINLPADRLFRYRSDGKLDITFGNQGSIYLPSAGVGVGYSVSLQRDGKILVAGQSCAFQDFSGCTSAVAVARYTAAGQLDRSFGTQGSANLPFGTDVFARRISVQEDDKIVVAATVEGVNWGFALARFGPDGAPDLSFNPCPATPVCGGRVITEHLPGYEPRASKPVPFGPMDAGWVTDMGIQENGKIVVAGFGPWDYGDFVLVRYNPDGSVDNCESSGIVRTTNDVTSRAMGMAIQPDGKILAAGVTGPGQADASTSGLLVRYMGGGTQVPPTSVTVQGADIQEPRSPGRSEAPFKLKLRLDAPACEPISFDTATKDGTATAGEDYVPTQKNVVFAKGDQQQTVEVPVLSDDNPEPAENFYLNVSNPVALEDPNRLNKLRLPVKVAEGRATILDDSSHSRKNGHQGEGSPAAAVSDTAAVEGDPPNQATLNVTLDKPSDQPVRLDYQTQGDSAEAGTDYAPARGQLIFSAGQTLKTVQVGIANDQSPEPTETFRLTLSNAKDATIRRPTGSVTIYDDDQPANQPQPLTQRANPATAGAAVLPGANLPPPSIAQGSQFQTTQQAQQQAQQQIQQQLQQQAQAQTAAGLMTERQRQHEVEKAGLSNENAYLASARERTPPVFARAFAFLAALMGVGTAMTLSRVKTLETARVRPRDRRARP